MKESEKSLQLAELFFDEGMEEYCFEELFRRELQLEEEKEHAAMKLANFQRKEVVES